MLVSVAAIGRRRGRTGRTGRRRTGVEGGAAEEALAGHRHRRLAPHQFPVDDNNNETKDDRSTTITRTGTENSLTLGNGRSLPLKHTSLQEALEIKIQAKSFKKKNSVTFALTTDDRCCWNRKRNETRSDEPKLGKAFAVSFWGSHHTKEKQRRKPSFLRWKTRTEPRKTR